jgi:hypothetical protein
MTRIPRAGTLVALALIAVLALAGPAAAKKKPPHGHGKGTHHRVMQTKFKRWAKHAKVKRAKGDPDTDGLSNWGEFRSHTRPRRPDTDHDGIGDASEDYDHDGLDNGSEEDAGTDPGVRDTDHDGVSDGDEDTDHDGLSNATEDRAGSNPRESNGSGTGTGNGNPDGTGTGNGTLDSDENAGTVRAFDGTTLTIALAAGGTLTGTVDADTDIACGSEDDPGSDDRSADGADAGDSLAAPMSQDGANACAGALVPGAAVNLAEIEGGMFVAIELVTGGG